MSLTTIGRSAALALLLTALLLAFGPLTVIQNASAGPAGAKYVCVYVPAWMKDEDSNWKHVDEQKFNRDLQTTLNDLANQGYEIDQILPLMRGRMESGRVNDGAWGSGYAVTQGVTVVAHLPAR